MEQDCRGLRRPLRELAFPLNTNDQRGTGFPRVAGLTADIRAFEVQPPAMTPTLTAAPAAVLVTPMFNR